QSPKYHFSQFSGTVWKTKVEVELREVKMYTGRHVNTLYPTTIEFGSDTRFIALLPVGTRLRIERLMRDNGVAALLSVTASLEDGKVVNLPHHFFTKNGFLWPGDSDSKEWGVHPDMLEKAD